MQHIRSEAAAAVNAVDASIWRWFSALLEERRIRWRYAFDNWTVSVDRRHVATERSFDDAIRVAKDVSGQLGIGSLGEILSTRDKGDLATQIRRQ
jgi:hypothetical protein